MTKAIEKNHLKNQLSKTVCVRCGANLTAAKFVPISELPLAVIAHVVCSNCNSENMVTITSTGVGIMPMVSDLTGAEVKRFVREPNVTFNDVLALRKKLKQRKLWNLLHNKDKPLAKKQKP